MLISPIGVLILIAAMLHFQCTNSIAEYKTCIISLKSAIDDLEVYGDSALVIFHVTEDWFVQEEKFLYYHECL